MESCIYRGAPTGKEVEPNSPVYECLIYGECTERPDSPSVATCENCRTCLDPESSEFSQEWLDPLRVFDRTKQLTHSLRNLLAKKTAFLVCGGPSATEDKLQSLSRRGHFSMAVNNKAGHTAYRPQAFVYSDDSNKFSHSIWYDPAIMKFCPLPKMKGYRARIKRKDPATGEFSSHGTIADCPNVWGFDRRSWMKPDDSFFLDTAAAWGNHQSGVDRTGEEKTVCTMLLALRLLYYLGARTVFLVGVDFNMTPGNEYSFNQTKQSAGASDSNNRQYRIVGNWLGKMQSDGVFDKFGLSIYNCNRDSGLKAFPYLPFGQALELSRGVVEEVPDLSHWYEKIDEEKMRQISKLVASGLSIEQVSSKVNEGIKKKKHHINDDTVLTYLRVLSERLK